MSAAGECLKLYVWEDVHTDYTSGIIFALAENVEAARLAVVIKENEDSKGYANYFPDVVERYKKWVASDRTDFYGGGVWNSIQAEPSVYETTVGFYVWGGG